MWTRPILRHWQGTVCAGIVEERGIRCFLTGGGKRKARGAKGGHPR